MSKRLLFLTPQLPYPPHQGTALRNFGLIEGLAKRGHEVTLVSFIEATQTLSSESPLTAAYCRVLTVTAPRRGMARRIRDLVAGYPDMARRLWSEDMRRALRDLLSQERFDAIHVEGIEMAPYLPVLRELAGLQGTLLIYDAHNAEYALQRRIFSQDARTPSRLHAAAYSWVQAGRLRRFETATCRGVDHVLACSEADADALRRLPHRTPITVVRNAISTAEYYPDDFTPADLPHPALVFTGKMDFRPNVDAALWFADAILPAIRQSISDAHFVIVGKHPHPRLDRLRGWPGVLFTGFVPDIQTYLLAADVYVAPLRMGSGTRFKLLEAMAMGRAVVSTRLGAEGLDVADGDHLLLADAADGFAEAVVALLQDEERRRAIGERGAALVRVRYDWSAVIPIVEGVYEVAQAHIGQTHRSAPTGRAPA